MIGTVKIIFVKVADPHWYILTMTKLHTVLPFKLVVAQFISYPGYQTDN